MIKTLTPTTPVTPPEQVTLQEVAPKFIKVVITEEDRQNAAGFTCCQGCLIWTAFTREGYKNVLVDSDSVHIGHQEYRLDLDCGKAANLQRGNYNWVQAPHYDPSLVGTIISATRIDP